MSDLQKRFPWHHEFLLWHNQRLEIYKGEPVRLELWKKAREWVVKDIRSFGG